MTHAHDAALHEHHEAPPEHQHHFETPVQQFESGKLGMWVFLATEILLFGGLFCAYAVYRALHPDVFVYASLFLDRNLGGINTVVLICSSLTMAWGVRAAQLGQRKLLLWLLALTIAGGFGFMGIKYVEYKHKWHEGLLWGTNYVSQADGHSLAHGGEHGESHESAPVAPPVPAPAAPAAPAAPTATAPGAPSRALAPGEDLPLIAPAATGPTGLAAPAAERSEVDVKLAALRAEPENVHLFFGIYFAMTGLHAIHVMIGMILIAYVFVRARRGDFSPRYFTPVDIVGLYWHLVDLIWIFLFPLLYLID